jgi:AcrR family transcriptional regulator
MATPSRNRDRRAGRTRQLLRQAFIEVAQEKGLMATSIQEIAERANVSRGTFYAHYADKYALIEALVREEFQRAVNTKFPLSSPWNKKTLHLLIQIVLEYFKNIYQRHSLSRDLAPIIERATHEELYELILAWLKQSRNKEIRSRVSLETLTQVMSWAIFGAAIQWSQETTTISSEQMARDVLLALTAVGHLASDGLPE